MHICDESRQVPKNKYVVKVVKKTSTGLPPTPEYGTVEQTVANGASGGSPHVRLAMLRRGIGSKSIEERSIR